MLFTLLAIEQFCMSLQTIIMVLTVLVMCGFWHTKSEAKTQTPFSLDSYDSELHAVVAAASKYNSISITEDREYIGGIFKKANKYYYSVMAGKHGEDRITTTLRFPKNTQLVALWHTHGAAGETREYFSDIDTAMAEHLNKPFYLADHTYQLKVFRPGAKVMSAVIARHHGLHAVDGYAKGELIMSLHSEQGGKQVARQTNS